MTQAASPPPVVECLDRPESQSYYGLVVHRAWEHWGARKNPDAEPIVLVFQLDEQGHVAATQVRSSASSAAGEAARSAFLAAGPYPPMPEAAKCLAGMSLQTTFKPQPEPRKFGLVLIAVALLPLLSIPVLLWQRTRPPRQYEPSTEVIPLRAGDDHLFRQSRLNLLAQFVMLLYFPMVAAARGSWWLLALLAVPVVLYEIWKQWRKPLFRITSLEIETFSVGVLQTGRIATHEVASWTFSSTAVFLRSARGEELQLPIGLLAKADAQRVMALLRGLAPGRPAVEPFPGPDLTRAALARMGLVAAVVVAATAVSLWFLLGA